MNMKILGYNIISVMHKMAVLRMRGVAFFV